MAKGQSKVLFLLQIVVHFNCISHETNVEDVRLQISQGAPDNVLIVHEKQDDDLSAQWGYFSS